MRALTLERIHLSCVFSYRQCIVEDEDNPRLEVKIIFTCSSWKSNEIRFYIVDGAAEIYDEFFYKAKRVTRDLMNFHLGDGRVFVMLLQLPSTRAEGEFRVNSFE